VEIVLIDTFIVPEESKAKFLEEVHKSAAFLRTLINRKIKITIFDVYHLPARSVA
jgi:hypothetical protein